MLVQRVTCGVCSVTTTLLCLDLIFSHHQVDGAGVTSQISSAAPSFLRFLFHFSSSCFISLPLYLIPFLPVPSISTSPICLTPNSFFFFLFFFLFSPPFFFHCSTSHTPTCCSKSLKGTEQAETVALTELRCNKIYTLVNDKSLRSWFCDL